MSKKFGEMDWERDAKDVIVVVCLTGRNIVAFSGTQESLTDLQLHQRSRPNRFTVVLMRTPTNRTVKVIPFQHSYTSGDTTPATCSSSLSGWRAKLQGMKMIDWIEAFLPCSRWIRTYNWREYLQPDMVSGITVGIMLVPQSMSYAKLAGLQPIYGLYTGLVPIFVYAIFGSSRQLAVGPVALVSLLVSNVLANVDSSGELYTELAILLSLMVGILECTMGLLRLGWLIRFISHSVISGFTTASAIVIALSQAKYFLGYSVVRSSEIIPLVKSIISGADKFSWPPFVMGSTFLAIMLTMKHLGKTRKNLRFLRAAGPLTAVVLGTTFVKIFHPSSISLVGNIPQGLPSFSIPKEFGLAKSLISTTFLITGVAILESVGIAKALAAKNGYELDSNQEHKIAIGFKVHYCAFFDDQAFYKQPKNKLFNFFLDLCLLFGLGVANIFGSFFSAYPATGSFSRSAVNNESGAKTGLSGIIMGIIICSTLLFMTPLFEYIPQCALAAIVISAVIGLVDYEEAMFLWRVDKKDFFLWTVTSATTLFFGVEIGVLVGLCWGGFLAPLFIETSNSTQKHIHTTGLLREYEISVDQSGGKRGPEVERIHFVILEMAPVTYADSSAVQALKELYQEYKSRNIQIAIANPNRDVLLTLAKSGFIDLVGKEWCFVRVHDAVQVCLQHVQTSTSSSLKAPQVTLHNSSSYLDILKERRKADLTADEMESGERERLTSKDADPVMEPLLSGKSHK
ncbi:STAS domain-containing protein [Cynara cardunculus var. scolymus]|uniref:STAS domain-containing protein n=1 Tax=Cynara cardunculus var. scolymus TaxID=59895 RepID=A0A103XEI4_CYNCS|nr:STAS domain-containing protein [Cynara cardunculus var. scolymus]